MTVAKNIRVRGTVSGVRADVNNGKAVIEELAKTFEEFKAEHQAEIDGVKAKFADVVQAEKVERIDARITELQAAIDKNAQSLAAARVGAGGGSEINQAMAEYKAAFNRYFRKGADAGLTDLAIKAALSTDSDPDGGYVVPDSMDSTIDRVLGTVSAMRSLARVQPISTAVYKKLVGKGGTSSGWAGERESRPQTDTSTLALLEFPAMEIYANPAATQSMLDDAAVDVEMWIADEVSTEFAEQEGAAFITGNGVNKPRGILGYDTVADASWAWGKIGYTVSGVAADISDGSNNGIDALTTLVYSIKKGFRVGAGFLMNRTLVSKVRKLKDANGQYLWQPSVQAGEPATLLGYPVTDDDNMPDVGANAFPIAFGNFRRGYMIVDRVGTRVIRDPYTNKPYVHFYTTKRVGGGVQNFEAIKLLKCSA